MFGIKVQCVCWGVYYTEIRYLLKADEIIDLYLTCGCDK